LGRTGFFTGFGFFTKILERRFLLFDLIDSLTCFCYYQETFEEGDSAMVEAKVTLMKDMHFSGAASSGHSLVLDADEQSGGSNRGFRPMELLLVGFGGCTGMDVISILRKKRQNVTGLEMNVKGEKAESHPHVFTTVQIEYVVKGKGVQKEAVERAIALSLDKYCSVGATLGKTAKITHSYRIIEA
jgi:putative redox protein